MCATKIFETAMEKTALSLNTCLPTLTNALGQCHPDVLKGEGDGFILYPGGMYLPLVRLTQIYKKNPNRPTELAQYPFEYKENNGTMSVLCVEASDNGARGTNYVLLTEARGRSVTLRPYEWWLCTNCQTFQNAAACWNRAQDCNQVRTYIVSKDRIDLWRCAKCDRSRTQYYCRTTQDYRCHTCGHTHGEEIVDPGAQEDQAPSAAISRNQDDPPLDTGNRQEEIPSTGSQIEAQTDDTQQQTAQTREDQQTRDEAGDTEWHGEPSANSR